MKRLTIGAALAVLVTLGMAAPARATQLRNKQDPNLCLAVSPAGSAIIWPCDSVGQNWLEAGYRSNYIVSLRDQNNPNPDLCLANEYALYGDGLRMLYCWDYAQSQPYMYMRWSSGLNDGCYYYVTSWTHAGQWMAMGVAGARNDQPLKEGTRVITWALTGETNQLWCPR